MNFLMRDMDDGEVDFWAKLPPSRHKAGPEVFTQIRWTAEPASSRASQTRSCYDTT